MENHIKDIARLRDSKNFLGFEFLSWLFLLLEHEDASKQIEHISKDLVYKTQVQVVLGNKLVSCILAHREQKTSVASPLLETSDEIFASLRSGQVVEMLAISVSLSEIVINITLHATDFALTQIKIKNNYESETLLEDEESLSEQDKNQEEVFLRLAALDDVERVLNGIFEYWLRLRLNPRDYAEELKRMRHQIEARLGNYAKRAADESRNNSREIAI